MTRTLYQEFVAQGSGALRGCVNGLATSVHFEWGTTTAYGNQIPSQSIGDGTTNVPVSASLTGLLPNTTYHFRVVATSGAGTTTGANSSFTTTTMGQITGQLAFTSARDGTGEIYIINADGTGLRNLNEHTARDRNPVWAPVAP